MNVVTCKDKFGKEYQIPKEKLSFRIGVSGILQNETGVFLIKHPRTNKWELPGGAVELDESLEEALKREYLEETGIKIKDTQLLTYREDYYYIESQDAAYHSIRLFFLVNPSHMNGEATDGAFIDYGNISQENTNGLTYSVLVQFLNPKNQ